MENRPKISYLSILVAVIGAAVVSSVWYSPFLFGKAWMELSGVGAGAAMPIWKPLVDLVREAIVIYVLAMLISRLEIVEVKAALSLGFWVWIGFPVQMLVGASLWDHKPWLLDAIHAGDWLIKLLLEAFILAKWRSVQVARLKNVTLLTEQRIVSN